MPAPPMTPFDIQFDALEPRRKKVAIVGFSPTTMSEAPYHDQAWEVWGMNQLYRFLPRATRWYEMHKDPLNDEVPGTNYAGWMANLPIPLIMLRRWTEYPTSIAYPIEERTTQFGDYWCSTVSYMIGDAIAEGFEEIGLWGIDMIADEEYGYQKPSCEGLLMYAKGAGIKVTLPSACALFKPYGKAGWRYGYDEGLPIDQWKAVFDDREKTIKEKHFAAQIEQSRWAGAGEEFAYWKMVKERDSRGGALAGRQVEIKP